MKISIAPTDVARPTSFASKRETGVVLEVWEKVKH
jgi:hypothetical protein